MGNKARGQWLVNDQPKYDTLLNKMYNCQRLKHLKSHYLRASDSLNYGLEIEKIDFLEILPIFNFCQEMNKNAYFSQFFTSVSMATTIFYF